MEGQSLPEVCLKLGASSQSRSQSLSLTSLSAADAQFGTLVFSWLHCGVTFYKRLKLEISSFMPGELLETCLDQPQRK